MYDELAAGAAVATGAVVETVSPSVASPPSPPHPTRTSASATKQVTRVERRRSTGARLPVDPGYGAARGAPGSGRRDGGADPSGTGVRVLRRRARACRSAPGAVAHHTLRRARTRHLLPTARR